MSTHNENEHPRGRDGKWVDKPGTGIPAESDVALAEPMVVEDADGDGPMEVEDLIGEISMGREFSNRRTWQMPDGSYRHAEIVYYAGGQASAPAGAETSKSRYGSRFYDWEGIEVPVDRELEWGEMEDIRSTIAALRDNRGDDHEERLANAPVLEYFTASRTEFLSFTDLDDRGSTETYSDYLYEDGYTYVAMGTLEEAERDAKERAEKEDWSAYSPENFEQVKCS